MSRATTTRRPSADEFRPLRQRLHRADDARQLRRAEAIVLTVHAWLHSFDRNGLDWLCQEHRGGAPPRITDEQRTALCRLADQPPAAVGLPYGRWSLAKLRAYAIRHRIVKSISREHLRRVLEKGGFTSDACSANSSVPTRSGRRFCGGFVPPGGSAVAAACCCSSMSRSSPSAPTAAAATPVLADWSCRVGRRRAASSTCSSATRSTVGGCGRMCYPV